MFTAVKIAVNIHDHVNVILIVSHLEDLKEKANKDLGNTIQQRHPIG